MSARRTLLVHCNDYNAVHLRTYHWRQIVQCWLSYVASKPVHIEYALSGRMQQF